MVGPPHIVGQRRCSLCIAVGKSNKVLYPIWVLLPKLNLGIPPSSMPSTLPRLHLRRSFARLIRVGRLLNPLLPLAELHRLHTVCTPPHAAAMCALANLACPDFIFCTSMYEGLITHGTNRDPGGRGKNPTETPLHSLRRVPLTKLLTTARTIATMLTSSRPDHHHDARPHRLGKIGPPLDDLDQFGVVLAW